MEYPGWILRIYYTLNGESKKKALFASAANTKIEPGKIRMPSHNADIAAVFEEIADLLESRERIHFGFARTVMLHATLASLLRKHTY